MLYTCIVDPYLQLPDDKAPTLPLEHDLRLRDQVFRHEGRRHRHHAPGARSPDDHAGGAARRPYAC